MQSYCVQDLILCCFVLVTGYEKTLLKSWQLLIAFKNSCSCNFKMYFGYIDIEVYKNGRKFISKLNKNLTTALIIINRKDPQICNKR